MQVYLDSFGASLRVRDGMFWIKPRHSDGQYLPVREVKTIFLTKGIHISSNALILAIHYQIPVLIIDRIGHPIGQVWSGQFGSIATIRKHQALFTLDIQGLKWIAELLQQRIEQQQAVLVELSTLIDSDTASFWKEFQQAKRTFEKILHNFQSIDWNENITPDSIRATFRGWEGTASRHYFKTIATAMPQEYRFSKRSKRPAYDMFNALLNYLYGMLYPMVELALMKAGLDPYAGVLHADEYNRPTLVFDSIERYRHWAEKVAVELCRKELLPANAFEETKREGVWLAVAGKSTVINCFLQFMDEKITYHQQVRKRITHIDLDAIRLATQLKGFEPENFII